jgi:hypothetical protein
MCSLLLLFWGDRPNFGGNFWTVPLQIYLSNKITQVFLNFFILDMHKNHPFVISGGVDQMVKVWECR